MNQDLRRKLNRITDTLWAGGVTNPVTYIAQISYLIYLKLLDEEESNREQLARLKGGNGNGISLFPQQAARFRWQKWRFKSGPELRDFLRDDVFPYMASLVKEEPQVADAAAHPSLGGTHRVARPARRAADGQGPELTALAFVEWCDERRIARYYIQPGKPDQNAFIERFNCTHRTEVLDAYLFDSLAEVRALTERWLVSYNQERPHDSLGRVPPLTFLPRLTLPEQSPFEVST